MTPFNETELFNACRTLFGPELTPSSDFLFYIQPGGVKSAYRKLAKETHPDRSVQRDPRSQSRMTERFRDATCAYDLLCNFLKQRNTAKIIRYHSPSGWAPQQQRSRGPSSAAPKTSTDESTQAHRKKHDNRDGATRRHLYQGNIPFRILEIGTYLYYRRLISYRELIESLVWQRGQRPKLGDIACRWGWLAPADIQHISNIRGPYRRFGDKAVELGLLNNRQVQTLLWFQRNQQSKLGEFFVQRGLLDAEQIITAVEDLRQHNLRVQMAARGSHHHVG